MLSHPEARAGRPVSFSVATSPVSTPPTLTFVESRTRLVESREGGGVVATNRRVAWCGRCRKRGRHPRIRQ